MHAIDGLLKRSGRRVLDRTGCAFDQHRAAQAADQREEQVKQMISGHRPQSRKLGRKRDPSEPIGEMVMEALNVLDPEARA